MGELELPGDLSLNRLDDRASLLSLLDGRRHRAIALTEAAGRAGGIIATKPATGAEVSDASGLDPRDIYTEKAFRLLHSPAVRQAFDLSSEDPKLRDRYGRTKLGQSVLLGRRLVGGGRSSSSPSTTAA